MYVYNLFVANKLGFIILSNSHDKKILFSIVYASFKLIISILLSKAVFLKECCQLSIPSSFSFGNAKILFLSRKSKTLFS